MNSVNRIDGLTRDAELSTTQGGTDIGRLRDGRSPPPPRRRFVP